MKPLTPKQQAFVREYLIDLNGAAAARRAGYKTKNSDELAHQLLGKTWVKAAIQLEMDARAKRTEITADYVLTTIRNTVERCQQAEPVLDRDGEPTGEYRFDSGAVLRGAELLGKHLKLFSDKLELGGPGGGPIPVASTVDLKALSADELAALAAILSKAGGHS